MNTQLRPSQIVLMVSGLVAVVFAFFPWIEVGGGSFEGFEVESESTNAFGDGLFPLATYVFLIGLIVGGLVALKAFANVNLPDNVLGFTWTQIYLALSIFAVLLSLGFLIVDFSGADRQIGLYISLLASIGLVVGAVMLHNEGEVVDTTPSGPTTPF